jgi:hypothetical protein
MSHSLKFVISFGLRELARTKVILIEQSQASILWRLAALNLDTSECRLKRVTGTLFGMPSSLLKNPPFILRERQDERSDYWKY